MKFTAVDFNSVAKKGWYVYCYLRNKASSTAKAYTPYYVGISNNARRPFEDHHQVPVPHDRKLIRLMKSGLSREEAEAHERLYIQRYGRKSTRSGILLNITEGGNASDPVFASARKKAEWQWKKNYESLREYAAELCIILPAANCKLPPYWIPRRVPKAEKKTLRAAFVLWNNLGYPNDDIDFHDEAVKINLELLKRLYLLKSMGHRLSNWLGAGERIQELFFPIDICKDFLSETDRLLAE